MRTPLHAASFYRQLEVVKYLVETVKVNINALDRWGSTPLNDADRFPEINRYLLSKRAVLGKSWPRVAPSVVNLDGVQYRMLYAAFYGDVEILNMIRQQGWKING